MSFLSLGINAKTNHTNHVTQVSQITNQAISPDGKIKVSVEGHSLKVSYCKRHMMDIQIGMDKAEFTPSFVATKPIVEDYEMLTGKRVIAPIRVRNISWAICNYDSLTMVLHSDMSSMACKMRKYQKNIPVIVYLKG